MGRTNHPRQVHSRITWHSATMYAGGQITLMTLPLGNINTEVTQRGWYGQWLQMMQAKSWEEITVAPQKAHYEGRATFKG